MKTKIKLNSAPGSIQIFNGLIWASVIIGCSLVLNEAEGADMVRNILIVGAGIHHTIVSLMTCGGFIKNKEGRPEKV